MHEFFDTILSVHPGWLYGVGAAFVAVSALLPPVPSTTLYVGLGALAGSEGLPNAYILAVSMLAGALVGDLGTYALGRRFRVTEWRMFSGARWQRTFNAARMRLEGNPLPLVLTSRFLPLGRLTMNVGAAITPVPLAAFTIQSLIAGIVWSAYSVGIGVISSSWPGVTTGFTVVVAIAVSLLLGRVINQVVSWFEGRRLDRR